MTCKIEMHNNKCEQGRNQCEFLGTAGGNLFGKKLTLLVDLKIYIVDDPAVALLGTESQGILAHVQQNSEECSWHPWV